MLTENTELEFLTSGLLTFLDLIILFIIILCVFPACKCTHACNAQGGQKKALDFPRTRVMELLATV